MGLRFTAETFIDFSVSNLTEDTAFVRRNERKKEGGRKGRRKWEERREEGKKEARQALKAPGYMIVKLWDMFPIEDMYFSSVLTLMFIWQIDNHLPSW